MEQMNVDLELNIQMGAALMASMVAGAIEGGDMPPKDVLEWYADNLTLTAIAVESSMLNDEDENKPSESDTYIAFNAVRDLMSLGEANQMFYLQARIRDHLKHRMLRLPEAYIRLKLDEERMPR